MDKIVNEYVKVGGDPQTADNNLTYWTLRGIYDREGKEALDKFVRNWKPTITAKPSRGYA